MSAPVPRPGILEITPYVGGKSSAAGAAKPIKLSSNEGALGPSPKAIEAAAKAANDMHRYPDGSATALRTALGKHFGLDPARIVIGHCDSYPRIDHWREIVHRGATVEADFLGMSFTPLERAGEPKVIELLKQLIDEGFASQIMLSQDVCHDSQLLSYGGGGYTYLQKTFLPRLLAAGVNQKTIDQITIKNPARVLTLVKPSA